MQLNPMTRIGGGFLAAIAVSAAVVAGCGSDSDPDRPPATATVASSDDAGSVSSSSVAPNTFLTFEGRRYRLLDLEQADLIDESAFSAIGEASEADIDQDDLTVYRRDGDNEAVYTLSASQAVDGAEGEGVPALWYRWVIEP